MELVEITLRIGKKNLDALLKSGRKEQVPIQVHGISMTKDESERIPIYTLRIDEADGQDEFNKKLGFNGRHFIDRQ